jgi:hypothetical protein
MFDLTEAPQLKGLSDELDHLAPIDFGGFDPESLARFLVEGRRLRDRFDALLSRAGAAYVAAGAWKLAGFESPAAHLASLRGEPVDGARADLRLARALASMPLTAQALAAGTITRAHAERLRLARGGSRAIAFAAAEQMLVDLATSLDGLDFDRTVAYWSQLADDDAAEADAAVHDRERWCGMSKTIDGRRHLQASMTRTAGGEFQEALQRITTELFETDWARARERLGRRPSASDLGRTPAQRRHDALVVMARRAMAAPPGTKQPRPLLVVHLGGGDALFGRLCELSDGTVITPGEALQLLQMGDIERAVHEPPDRVRVSERTRLFRGAERRAVELRDRYCTFPGCRAPAERCEVDHVVPSELGGPTTQENGRLRCPTHHPGWRRDQPWLRTAGAGPPPGAADPPADPEPRGGRPSGTGARLARARPARTRGGRQQLTAGDAPTRRSAGGHAAAGQQVRGQRPPAHQEDAEDDGGDDDERRGGAAVEGHVAQHHADDDGHAPEVQPERDP